MESIFPHHILIIEPDDGLIIPYRYLTGIKHIRRVTSIDEALQELSSTTPDLIFLSTSFSTEQYLTLLEKIKDLSIDYIVPLVWVVNFNQPISTIMGTHWAGRVGIVHTLASPAEVTATLRRIWEQT